MYFLHHAKGLFSGETSGRATEQHTGLGQHSALSKGSWSREGDTLVIVGQLVLDENRIGAPNLHQCPVLWHLANYVDGDVKVDKHLRMVVF